MVVDLCEQEQLTFLPWAPVQEADRNPAVAEAARAHGASEHQVALATGCWPAPRCHPPDSWYRVRFCMPRRTSQPRGWSSRRTRSLPSGRGYSSSMETVKPADGTVIAFDRVGQGPPLVVTLGAFCDRMTFVPPAELTARFTVYTWDRRGRGGSGDTALYSPDLEVADLLAVVEAAGVGARTFVYGHSSGAALALRAAWSGVPMAKLVAYEAPFIIPGTREVPTDPSATITRLVEAGRRGEAVRFWMGDVVVVAPAGGRARGGDADVGGPGGDGLTRFLTTWR